MMLNLTPRAGPFRAGYIAVVGASNAGKSTLVNRLVDYRVSIVSPRPQTTRHIIRGIITGDDHQLVFLDTPGLMRRAADLLEQRMVHRIGMAIEDADLVLFVAEPRKPGPIEQQLVTEITSRRRPAVLALNKVDTLLTDKAVEDLVATYRGLHPFVDAVPISALNGSGVERLMRVLVAQVPEGEAIFDADDVTDRNERFLAGEMVREAVFATYGQEVPYDTAVIVDDFREASPAHGGKDFIRVILYVDRDSQRGILIGQAGQALKQVGTLARTTIEETLSREVHLELFVQTRRRWRKDAAFLKELEYY